ncbi:MAG: rhomboid family intramembrane serine protease [Gemmataceae bacterium]
MGIYDRDYYRGSRNPLLQSLGRTGQVCKWLIVINVAIFLVQVMTISRATPDAPSSIGWFTELLWLKPSAVFYGQIWRLITSAFLHNPDHIWHIVFNMLFLWWFGSELEGLYGSKEFLTFYLVAALAGSIGYMLYPGVYYWSHGMLNNAPPALGASGAVTGVMVLYAFHFPKRVIYLFFVLPVPIWLFVGFQVLQDIYLFALETRGRPSGIGVTAHLGGALLGFLYYKYQMRLSPLLTQFRLPAMKRRPKLKVVHIDKEEVGRMSPVSGFDEQLEAKVDAVLEKIQKYGKESLTAHERTILEQASQVYKQRRS